MLGSNLKRLGKSIVFIISVTTPLVAIAALSGSLSKEAIEERLAPEESLNIKTLDTNAIQKPTHKADANNPGSIYDKNCKLCHASGLAGAPKFRNKKDWQARISQGLDVMTKKAVQGFKAMPPKGNCLNCSNEDIQKTIEYMIETIK